jgi:hypothetical protein
MRSWTAAFAMMAAIGIFAPASAENNGSRPKQGQSQQTTTTAPEDKDTKELPPITLEEGIAVPYRPCINARGWVNGRLVCAD